VQVFQANTRALEVQQERTLGSVKSELRQASPPLVGNIDVATHITKSKNGVVSVKLGSCTIACANNRTQLC
jgi:hypothetical protein